ncbi:MAG TPA: hypothetical protein VHM30_20185 [Gemmatimonadaceae bacterium]|nr:hypothetical protein [Gemmatimonadaceae bacterium]
MTQPPTRAARGARLLLVLTTFTLAGCISGMEPGNPAPVVVEVTSDRTAVAPGQNVVVLLVATPRGSRSLRYAKLTLSGAYVATDSVTGSGTQPVTIERTYTIPPATPRGQILVTGVAVATDGSSARVDGTINVSP